MYSTDPPTFVDYGIKTIQNYTYIHHSKTRPNLTAPNIPTAQQNSDAKPTKSIPIPKPALTSVAQHHVTDAARLTFSSATSRRMFFDEVARKCIEVASQEEKEAEKPVPKPRRRPTSLSIKPQNAFPTHDSQGDTPQTSATTSGVTYTMPVTSNPGEATTATTTANTADSSSPHPEWKNYNTSGKTMRRRMEQGLPNQAITLFAPIGMAENLTKI